MSHQHGGLHLRRRALGVTCTAAATIERSKTASSAAVTPRARNSGSIFGLNSGQGATPMNITVTTVSQPELPALDACPGEELSHFKVRDTTAP
ncbi:hypothetical protein VTH82DRAFT_2555 [Thermothelomyces myriococcoides]